MITLPISTARPTRAQPQAEWPFLLPYAVYVVHTLEELPGFAAWASAHFGPETTGAFAAYHIPLILLVGLTGWRAMRTGGRVWVVLATAFQIQFGLNALFHLTVWAGTGDYSPGAVTGATVSIPATVYYLVWARRHRIATGRQVAAAAVIGALIAAATIGFLFL
ncbi:HXXEE domain-containing protein [Glycomyces sp. NRRL B-16210]|uniref:HXXEE domain-containing protein n=1 Tax=Glycomyces sp. NRRL B-16210 TaxID=1463821 RepID=UPI0004BE50A3|nr:HXXEE domain-containing protein [Glycomyces sp. NRRL B-16210]